MAISYVGSNNISSSNTLRGMCIWEAGNVALVTDQSATLLRWYNLATTVMTASTTVTSFPGGVAIINSASAVVVSYNSATVDFIELASNTRSAVSGSNSGTSSLLHPIAADPSNSTAMYITGSTGVLGRIRGSNFTVTSVNVRSSSSNGEFRSIILKSPGRWLVGTTGGRILEVDFDGNVIGQMAVSLAPTPGTQYGIDSTTGALPLDIYGLTYDNNVIVAASSIGNIFTIDWTSKEVTGSFQINNRSSGSIALANTGSGDFVYALQAVSVSCSLLQIDSTVRFPTTTGYMYGANAANNTISLMALNTQTGRGVYSYLFGPVVFFDVTSQRATTTRTFTVNPGGVDQKCNLTLIEEVSGVATGRPILDTIMQSPATYRVPTGKTIIEIVKVGEGISSSQMINRYTT